VIRCRKSGRLRMSECEMRLAPEGKGQKKKDPVVICASNKFVSIYKMSVMLKGLR
jgi:hypothetical protein